MPANYAHNRFGKLVMACPGEWLKKYERLFLAGCHGPDPLFYYDPFGPNEIRDLAEKIHGTSGKILFTDLCQMVREEPEGPGWAFLFGLLAHYCLDSSCHPTVNALHRSGECNHTELETEFDRFLMELDGISRPHTRDLGRHMKLTEAECATAASLFPPLTPEQYTRCTEKMRKGTALMSGKKVPRFLLERVLPRYGPTVAYQLMCKKANPRVAYKDPELLALFDRGVALYPVLAAELDGLLRQGTPLSDRFLPDFD